MSGTSTTRLRPDLTEGISEGGRERIDSISGVKEVRSGETQRPEGKGTSVSKAGRGITPGSRRRRVAQA